MQTNAPWKFTCGNSHVVLCGEMPGDVVFFKKKKVNRTLIPLPKFADQKLQRMSSLGG